MKKVILFISIIAIVAVTAISLVACNSATPQGQLQNLLSDHNQESFEYNVFAKNSSGARIDGYDGTYTVTLDAYAQGKTVPWIDSESSELSNLQELFDVQKGVLVKGVLIVGEGDEQIVYETGCYFNIISGSSYMVPANTYRIQKKGGVEQFVMYGEYDGSTLRYTRIVNGETNSGKVEGKATTYFDNNEFHQSLRTLTTFSESMSFSFSMPLVSASEATYVTLSTTISSTSTIKNSYTVTNAIDDGIECYKMSVSRNEDVSGLSQTLYYAKDDIKINGWGLKNVLMQIEEPFKIDGDVYTMVYELTSASLS